MKITALTVTAAAVLALSFGAWGQYTQAGRMRFDEMAGILPLLSWYAGLALSLLALICWVLLLRRLLRRDAVSPNHDTVD